MLSQGKGLKALRRSRRIPTPQKRRVASLDWSETNKRSPLHTSLLHVYYRPHSEYRKRLRLHVQNQSGGCILSHTDPPRQPGVPSVRSSWTRCFNSEYFPPSSRHIGTTLPEWLVSSSPGLSVTSLPLNANTRSGGLQTKCQQVATGTSLRRSVSQCPAVTGSMLTLYPQSLICCFMEFLGVTQLSPRSHPVGSAHKIDTETFHFYGSVQRFLLHLASLTRWFSPTAVTVAGP